MRQNKPQFLLDECVQTKDARIRKKFGFINSTEIIPSGSTDEDVLKTASRRNLRIITADIRFVLEILTQGKPVIFENHKHERIHLIPKNKPKIEKNCHLKYKHYTTYYILHSGKIVMP